MLVVTRFVIAAEAHDVFLAEARTAIAALSVRDGFVRARVSRATDDGDAWLLLTEWASVGAWRRALGGYDVKLGALPLLARATPEPSGYEVIVDTEDADSVRRTSDRAADADVTGPGQPRS